MNTLTRTLLISLAATGLVVTADTPLVAQTTVRPGVEAQSSDWRPGLPLPWNRSFRGQARVEEALRTFGYRPDRLTREQYRALDDAFSQLLPDADPRRYTLNRSQATALVYLALVLPDQGVGGQPNRRGCDALVVRVYELGDILPADGRAQSRPLTREEQDQVHREARQIQQLARTCGQHFVAEEAQELASLAAQRRVEREPVLRQIRRMKAAIRSALAE